MDFSKIDKKGWTAIAIWALFATICITSTVTAYKYKGQLAECQAQKK